MQKRFYFFITMLVFISHGQLSGQIVIKSNIKFTGNKTLTYLECVEKYEQFAQYEFGQLLEFGLSDIGKPIKLFLLSKDFSGVESFNSDKPTFLINNAIHPGEPCGVDASVQLVKTLLALENLDTVLDHINIGIIPMYNIGGVINRGCCSRANQNGPEFYGFRGNARNLDLNRDFIKCDSKNAAAFYAIYQFLNPHVFLDTHTSNGADYQHVMTLITTQTDKATPVIGSYLKNQMVDELYSGMAEAGYPMSPYVHTVGSTPEEGIFDYLETPRYSTGYASLFNSLAFVSEAHMLKSYEQRVQSTYELIIQICNYTLRNGSEIVDLKSRADRFVEVLKTFEVNWELDTVRVDSFQFSGYEAEFLPSTFSSNERLSYNQMKPWERNIPYYNRYLATERVKIPEYYIIPQAWREVISVLRKNKVEMTELKSDTTIEVEYYYIVNEETKQNPYEGHYVHSNVEVITESQIGSFYAGDILIKTNQPRNRLIVETLEPTASDSFFKWNFFDEILQQKEWFSSYVFEDKAAKMLENDADLKEEFSALQRSDEAFNENQWAQLYWLYKRSDNYEITHNRYPVARWNVYN